MGKQFQLHAEILVAFHGCHQVEVFEVKRHEFCVGCGYDTVEEESQSEEVSCRSSVVTWVVYEVATHGDTHAKLVSLSVAVHASDSAIGDIAASFFWDIILVDDENGFCGSGKAYYFLAKRFCSYVFVLRVLHEVAILKKVACLVVEDGLGKVTEELEGILEGSGLE